MRERLTLSKLFFKLQNPMNGHFVRKKKHYLVLWLIGYEYTVFENKLHLRKNSNVCKVIQKYVQNIYGMKMLIFFGVKIHMRHFLVIIYQTWHGPWSV